MTPAPTPPATAPPTPWYKTAAFKWLAPIVIGVAFRIACPLITNPEGRQVCEVAQQAWNMFRGQAFPVTDDGGVP
jgi:hypothetical protein